MLRSHQLRTLRVSSQEERKKEWPVYRMFCKTENISLQQTAGSERFTRLTRNLILHLNIFSHTFWIRKDVSSQSVCLSVHLTHFIPCPSLLGMFSVPEYAYIPLLNFRFAWFAIWRLYILFPEGKHFCMYTHSSVQLHYAVPPCPPSRGPRNWIQLLEMFTRTEFIKSHRWGK